MPAEPLHLRAFAAIALPGELLDIIQAVVAPLREHFRPEDIRWTRRDQIHLTLKFFGNVPADRVDELATVLAAAVRDFAPIPLRIAGLGFFPSSRRPNVIWLGLHGDLERLHSLQSKVDSATPGFGSHSEDRQFHPHLTIGRVRVLGSGARRIGEVLERAEVQDLGGWTAEELKLIQSRLTPKGSIYEDLAALPLRG